MESISFVSILDKPEILEFSTKIGHSDVECSAGLHLICVNSTDIQKMQKNKRSRCYYWWYKNEKGMTHALEQVTEEEADMKPVGAGGRLPAWDLPTVWRHLTPMNLRQKLRSHLYSVAFQREERC